MLPDKRSRKVLLVAHCILNQNAKLDRCAHYPGAVTETAQLLIDSGVGILQMPCPELLALGLDRETVAGDSPTVGEEDTRIGRRMAESSARAMCQQIADQLIFQVEEYRRNGFDVIGLLGINGSPTCAVETTWADDQEKEGAGVFIQILQDGMMKKGFACAMKGIRASEPEQAISTLKKLLHRST